MRAADRLRTYGLTDEAYRAMLERQEGRCAVCLDEAKLCVDHDHKTGKVRGLLCSHCNTAIGHLRDDPSRIRRAADYLEEK